MIVAEDIGRQILTYGERYMHIPTSKPVIITGLFNNRIRICRKPVDQFLKTVDQLTLRDIADFTSKVIAKPLTMASFGEGN